jgi:predicted membrane protein
MKKNRTNKLFWGIILILAAVLLVLDSVGAELGFLKGLLVFRTIAVILLLAGAFEELHKREFGGFFFSLAIAFFIYEEQIARWLSLEDENIISNWTVILVAVLLSIGFSLLFGKRTFTFTYNGRDAKHKVAGSYVTNIDCSAFDYMHINNELGSCEVHFSNVESYTGNGVLTVNNELGSVKIYVPSEWAVTNRIENELGSVQIKGETLNGGKTLIIDGTNELGSVQIIYIQ